MRAYHKTPEKFRSAGEKTHGKGKHKAHKIGDRISFKTPKGRTTGKVTKVSKEFYMVSNKDKLYKVNRNSILYSMGYVDAINRTPTQPPIIKSCTIDKRLVWIHSPPSNDEKFPRRIGADIDNRRRNPFFAAPR